MASFNKTILLGNVTKDFEAREAGGSNVATVRLAVNNRFKKAGKEETLYIDCEVWGKTCDVATKYLKKGDPVLMEGSLKTDTWEKDGKNFYKTFVNVESMQLMSKKVVDGEQKDTAAPEESTPPADGDIPF